MKETKAISEQKDARKIVLLSILIIIMLSLLAQGCQENCIGPTMTITEPVFAAREDVMNTSVFAPPQLVETPGKIYYKDNHIFVGEVDRGIHVIDNTNPANPVKIGFLDIPGNKDMAAKGDYLYADNYLDLVVFDISDKSNIFETNRVENVFFYDYYYQEDMGLMVDTRSVEVEYEDCQGNPIDFSHRLGEYGWYGGWMEMGGDLMFRAQSANTSAGAGIGGSLARFTIAHDKLYTINDWQMKVFDVEIGDSPVPGDSLSLGWGIETIFPYEDKLFLGAMSGMHIYDNSNPSLPEYLSTYEHINTCDPVVVQDDYAYVTLRNGTECQTFTNQLDVIDVSDARNPTLVSTFPMHNPHGLGIDGDCLFITEGDYGLKLFNASDPMTIGYNLIHHHLDVHAHDVIPLGEVLMMIGEDGLYQYEYDCNDKLELISTISFSQQSLL